MLHNRQVINILFCRAASMVTTSYNKTETKYSKTIETRQITDRAINGQLDNRISYFVRLYGSKEKLEQVAGKPISKLKEDYREVIEEQMLREAAQHDAERRVK